MHPSVGLVHCRAQRVSSSLPPGETGHTSSWPTPMARLWEDACPVSIMTIACAGSLEGSAISWHPLRPCEAPCNVHANMAVARAGLGERQHLPVAHCQAALCAQTPMSRVCTSGVLDNTDIPSVLNTHNTHLDAAVYFSDICRANGAGVQAQVTMI